MKNFHKRLASFSLGLVLTLGVGVCLNGVHHDAVSVKAEDSLVYTLTPAAGTNNSYAGNCDITIDKITWNVTGNSSLTPWRIGGKSLTNVNRSIYSKTAITSNVSKIDVTFGAASSITVNSLNVTVHTSADDAKDRTNPVSTVTATFAANSKISFARPDGANWEGMFYNINLNVTVSGDSNKYVAFSKAEFYGSAATKPVLEIDNAPSGNLDKDAVGTFTATTENITDPVITWSSSNTDVMTINETTGAYTAVDGGYTKITASATGSNLTEAITTSFEVTVNYDVVTIAKALEITNALESGTTSTFTLKVKGYIVDLVDTKNLYVADTKLDGEGNLPSTASKILVFSYNIATFVSKAVLNSELTITGVVQNYNGTTPEIKNPVFNSDYSADAEAYAFHFLKELATVCADPTIDNSEALTPVWETLKTKWESVDATSKETLKNAKGDDATYGEFAKKYDHIMTRYGETKLGEGANFIGRSNSTSTSSVPSVLSNSDNSLTITIIVLVSVISVSLIVGTTLIIRKRKVN